MAIITMSLETGATHYVDSAVQVLTPDGKKLASTIQIDDYICVIGDGSSFVKVTGVA